jgi:hypothetical protein
LQHILPPLPAAGQASPHRAAMIVPSAWFGAPRILRMRRRRDRLRGSKRPESRANLHHRYQYLHLPLNQYLSIDLPINLSTYLSTYLSACLPACLPACLLPAYLPSIISGHTAYSETGVRQSTADRADSFNGEQSGGTRSHSYRIDVRYRKQLLRTNAALAHRQSGRIAGTLTCGRLSNPAMR